MPHAGKLVTIRAEGKRTARLIVVSDTVRVNAVTGRVYDWVGGHTTARNQWLPIEHVMQYRENAHAEVLRSWVRTSLQLLALEPHEFGPVFDKRGITRSYKLNGTRYLSAPCPYCGETLANAPKRYGAKLTVMTYTCQGCGVYVGVHRKQPAEPLGVPADAKLKLLRTEFHNNHFDPIWKQKNLPRGVNKVTRNMAYAALASVMGIPAESAHGGMFNCEQIEDAIEIIETLAVHREIVARFSLADNSPDWRYRIPIKQRPATLPSARKQKGKNRHKRLEHEFRSRVMGRCTTLGKRTLDKLFCQIGEICQYMSRHQGLGSIWAMEQKHMLAYVRHLHSRCVEAGACMDGQDGEDVRDILETLIWMKAAIDGARSALTCETLLHLAQHDPRPPEYATTGTPRGGPSAQAIRPPGARPTEVDDARSTRSAAG